MAGSCGKVNRQTARFIEAKNFAWRAGWGNEDPRMSLFPAPGLTVCEMGKAMKRAIRIHDLPLVSKADGNSGDYLA